MESRFLCLVLAGDYAGAKVALANGANPNETDGDLYTPLHRLAVVFQHEKHLAVANLLVESGAEVNPSQPGTDGWTPLHLAAWAGNEASVKFLLSVGGDKRLADWFGQTAHGVAMSPTSKKNLKCRELLHVDGVASWGETGTLTPPPAAIAPAFTRDPCPCGVGLLLHAEPCRPPSRL